MYLLKHKSNAFDRFKSWKIMKNQIDRKIKVLRIDNGLEFCNRKFNQFCEDHQIVRHRTIILTPQKNGVAERTNRTLSDKVMCMLSGSGLDKSF